MNFMNKMLGRTSAAAKHILVKDQAKAQLLLQQIKSGESSFASLAAQHSQCPSGQKGGDLGNFQPGQMVPEFDKVIFDKKTQKDEVYGPTQTQFGYHLIQVTSRTDWK